MKILTFHYHTFLFCWQNITLYILACKILHMTFFSVDMCKLLSEIIKLAHANNLASQLSHVWFFAIAVNSF